MYCFNANIEFQAPGIPWKLQKLHSLTAVPALQPVFMYLNSGGSRILTTEGPKSEGEARIEEAKRLRIEGEARTEGEARKKAGRGLGKGFGESLLRKFLKI